MTRGAEAVTQALIEAAATLFAEQSKPSVRAIAKAAGVNHGLVHHYFGSKEGLLNATLAELSSRQLSELGEGESGAPVDMIALLWEISRQDQRLVRILARQMLDGASPAQIQGRFPVVEMLIETLTAQGVIDARASVAEGLSLALGMLVFGPWVSAATGMEPDQLHKNGQASLALALSERMGDS